MRRWLALLMLVFLPLQFSWGAVASYCAHESGVAAEHVGHHDHAGHSHAAQGAEAESQSQADQGKADRTTAGSPSLDCGHCHGYCAGMVDAVTRFEPQVLGSAPQGLSGPPRAEPMPAQPERPQWAGLA